MTFNQDLFNRFILDNGILGTFPAPKRLASGRNSHWYVNWRTAVSDAFTMDELVGHVIEFIDEKIAVKIDSIHGVPEGATGIGLLTMSTYAQGHGNYAKGSHRLSIGRTTPKDHGDPKDRYFVGAPRGNTILIEDVTTTGKSVLGQIDKIKRLGDVNIVAVIGLTNRMERRDDRTTVKEAVEATGALYFEMSKGPELLKLSYARAPFPEAITAHIEREFEQYGIEPLQLR